MTGLQPRLSVLDLTEWESHVLDGAILSDSDRHMAEELVQGGRLFIDELRTGVRVKASSWVGIVRFETFEVRIVPKLAGDNLGLVDMIEFATGLEALRRSSGIRSLHAAGGSLFDLLALLLAEACESVLRGGLFADYLEHEDELPVVRGRLLADKQFLRRFGQIDRLICRFDEHEQDILENQLLTAALILCGKRVVHESVKHRVRRLQAIFEEVCNPDLLNLETAQQQLSYHRLNEHYRDAHGIAWLILEGLGVKDLLAQGRIGCFAFLIDMNLLFEQFVFRLVDRLMAGTGYRVRYQRADRSIIWNALTNQPYRRVVPDLLIEVREAPSMRFTIDAKYKLYDDRKVDMDDVYQNFLYAYAYGGSGFDRLPSALLVYPSSTWSQRSLRLRIQSAQKLAAAEILVLGLSIPDALAEVRQRTPGPVTNALMEAITTLSGVRTPRSVAA